jgi:hypothetical protein
MSVGSGGTPGPLNTFVLRQINARTSLIPRADDLKPGYAIRKFGKKLLCFVVTVGESDTATTLTLNLEKALNDRKLMHAKHVWIPLMGTGAGGLSYQQSDEIISAVLSRVTWCNSPDVRIDIAYPQDVSVQESNVLPRSPAVNVAIQLAWKLNNDRPNPGAFVTTSLMFFALVEGQANATAFELHGDSPAAVFSDAVHRLAGDDRYREAWRKYFGAEYAVIDNTLAHFNGGLSKNVQAVLESAGKRAADRAHSSIEMDDLIEAMLNYSDGRFRRVLAALDLSAEQLLGAYREGVAGVIGTTLLNDVASGNDLLGYATYANAITSFLQDSKTPPPLSISIQAPWGVGKSSLMQQIRERLDPRMRREKYKPRLQDAAVSFCHITLKQALGYLDRKTDAPPRDVVRGSRFPSMSKWLRDSPRLENTAPENLDVEEGHQRWTVWFNAWKYDTSEQVWSGLVDAIVSQISDRLPPAQRELFLFRLQLARIDDGIVRRKIYDRVLSIWWSAVRKWFLLGVGAVATSAGASQAAAKMQLPHDISVLVASLPAGSAAMLSTYLFVAYLLSSKKTESEPASFSLAQYLKVPDYDQTLGSIHHIHKDLLRVLSLTPRSEATSSPSPIVIFIDDLDRCSPSKVASVVEGVNMFLASDEYRCMFVIGMDPQMIAAALEEAHAKVLDQLPSFECTVPLGWRFMDKFIQLPFTIPPSDSDRIRSYVDGLTTPNDAMEEGLPPASPIPVASTGTVEQTGTVGEAPPAAAVRSPGPEIDSREAQERLRESRDVGIIIREAVASTSGNPREIKRLTNLARLYLGLRNARQRNIPTWQAPGLSQYARWIILTLRWPDMMRWLQWGADECSWGDDRASRNLQERRLQVLEGRAARANDLTAWEEGVASVLNVSSNKTTGWMKDAKLFEFFKSESMLREHDRLSAAVVKGFW